MRTEPAILIVSLAIGMAAYLLLTFFGLSYWPIAVLPALVAFVLLSIVMAYTDSESVRELVKQIAVWLGIVVLLPMSVWYGTSAFSPPPDWKQYSKSTSRIDERI